MIIIFRQDASAQEIGVITDAMKARGLITQEIVGQNTRMLGLAGDTSQLSAEAIERASCIERVMKVQEPYKLASRRFHPQDSVISCGESRIGGGHFAVIAGPCSVESEAQILTIARDVKASGATFLRGGAFKPRTSPYAFAGLGLDGLTLLKIARQKTGLPIVSEILSTENLDAFARDVDIIQVGARNMQNFTLLREVGGLKKPVLLKRGLCSSIEELLMAAEYIIAGGSPDVILCERGIRTFESSTRNTLDLSAVPVLQQKTHLPVVVDPSHATGYWHLVPPLALAAVAAGADGLIIEVHDKPEFALCDGAQSITPPVFHQLMRRVQSVRKALEDVS